MRAVLRSLHSPDTPDGSLVSFIPTGEEFGLLVEADIGPNEAEGSEVFSFVACSPGWVAGQLPKGFRWGHGLLVLRRWQPQVVERALQDLCLRAEGATWPEVAARLSTFLDREFADYRE